VSSELRMLRAEGLERRAREGVKKQLAVGSWQVAKGSERRAKVERKLKVGNGSWQLASGSELRAQGAGRRAKEPEPLPRTQDPGPSTI
jgi:hypothetical protein